MDDNLNEINETTSDDWGGHWTDDKMEIFIKYIKAYLTIMNKNPYFQLWYFDGFAGSGQIQIQEPTNKKKKTHESVELFSSNADTDSSSIKKRSIIEGIAPKVLEIDKPCSFDGYYFVELDKNKANSLQQMIKSRFPNKSNSCYVVSADCNEKVIAFADFLRKDNKRRGLAILDPFGMTMNWSSIETLKNLGCDIWILVPTDIGVNRLLKKDGDINEAWMLKLTHFLGLPKEEIKRRFYNEKVELTLFGESKQVQKVHKAIDKIAELYCERLKEVWQHVSKPFEMKNATGSIMFHFIFASQVKAGVKIADEIIKSKK